MQQIDDLTTENPKAMQHRLLPLSTPHLPFSLSAKFFMMKLIIQQQKKTLKPS
jgi:hypothetical protein